MCDIMITPGQGGEDAQLFASDLAEAVSNWAKRENAPFTKTNTTRQITLRLPGLAAGRVAWLTGRHRVQHYVSGKRQTSYADVTVLEDAAAGPAVKFWRGHPDVTVEAVFSSGPGGQHVNKTKTGVRAVHLPTETEVTCQDERSQLANVEAALAELARRVTAKQAAGTAAELRQERAGQVADTRVDVIHDHFRSFVEHKATGTRWTPKQFGQGRFGRIAAPVTLAG